MNLNKLRSLTKRFLKKSRLWHTTITMYHDDVPIGLIQSISYTKRQDKHYDSIAYRAIFHKDKVELIFFR
jgi:hypothetical protein